MRPKLIIVSTDIDGRGGIQSAVRAYCQGFDIADHEYLVVSSHKEGDRLFLRWLLSVFSLFKLSIQYRKSNAVFWFHCGPWLSLTRKFTLALIPKMFGLKTIVHLHSHAMEKYITYPFSRIFIRILLAPYSNVIVLTAWWKKKILMNLPNLNVDVSPNPVSINFFNRAFEYISEKENFSKKTNNELNIVSMSRLMKGKGFELVVRSLIHLPEKFVLTIIGSGPLESELKELIVYYQLEHRVTMLGWLDEEEKSKILAESDIFCLPSTLDSFGMVFIEAMSHNLPIVAAAQEVTPDIITDKEGVVLTKLKPELIAEAIVDVATNIKKYHNAGPQKVIDNYDPEKIVNRFLRNLVERL